MIEIGDEIQNCIGEAIEITKVERGKSGILWQGTSLDTKQAGLQGYLPYELPPTKTPGHEEWHGWGRAHIRLVCGQTLGSVAFPRDDLRPRTIEEYDLEWERTEQAMRAEEIPDAFTSWKDAEEG